MDDEFNLNKPLTRAVTLNALKQEIKICKKEFDLLTNISNTRIEELEIEIRRLKDCADNFKREYKELLGTHKELLVQIKID